MTQSRGIGANPVPLPFIFELRRECLDALIYKSVYIWLCLWIKLLGYGGWDLARFDYTCLPIV